MNNFNEFNKDDAYKNLERVNFWINNCDTKSSFILAFIGVVSGLIFSNKEFITFIKEILSNYSLYNKDILLINVLFIFTTFQVLSIILLLLSLVARVKIKWFKKMGVITDSIFFFNTIKLNCLNQYKEKVNDYFNNTLAYDDLLSQIIINSKICSRKFRLYNYAIKSLIIAIIALLILLKAYFVK